MKDMSILRKQKFGKLEFTKRITRNS